MTVYYFTGSGNSREIALRLAEELDVSAVDITLSPKIVSADDVAVLVFPVYCQNIPKRAKSFLKESSSDKIALIATFGRISYGNVIREALSLTRSTLIAAACVPMRHSFVDEQMSFDVSLLSPLIERIQAPCAAEEIPNSKKDALADIFPDMRSRLGMKISRLDSCVSCGKCDSECPTGAIRNGRIGSSCIRCQRCVHICPEHALEAKPRLVLKKYLDKNLGRINEPIIYL